VDDLIKASKGITSNSTYTHAKGNLLMKKSMRLKHRLKKLSAAQKKIEDRKLGEKLDA
jgi:hypothetical protein